MLAKTCVLAGKTGRRSLCCALDIKKNQGRRSCTRAASKKPSSSWTQPPHELYYVALSAFRKLPSLLSESRVLAPSSVAARRREHQLHDCRSSAASDSCTPVNCRCHTSRRPSRANSCFSRSFTILHPSRMLVQAAMRATTCCAWQNWRKSLHCALAGNTGSWGVGRATEQRTRNNPRKDTHPHGLILLMSYTCTIFTKYPACSRSLAVGSLGPRLQLVAVRTNCAVADLQPFPMPVHNCAHRTSQTQRDPHTQTSVSMNPPSMQVQARFTAPMWVRRTYNVKHGLVIVQQ